MTDTCVLATGIDLRPRSLADMIRCNRCNRTFVRTAAKKVAGEVVCPGCAPVVATEAEQLAQRIKRQEAIDEARKQRIKAERRVKEMSEHEERRWQREEEKQTQREAEVAEEEAQWDGLAKGDLRIVHAELREQTILLKQIKQYSFYTALPVMIAVALVALSVVLLLLLGIGGCPAGLGR